jgi:hypothetical protein
VQDKLARCLPDVMLCPAVGQVGMFDVHHLDECIEAGIAAVHAHEAELIALRDQARLPEPLSALTKLGRRIWRRS